MSLRTGPSLEVGAGLPVGGGAGATAGRGAPGSKLARPAGLAGGAGASSPPSGRRSCRRLASPNRRRCVDSTGQAGGARQVLGGSFEDHLREGTLIAGSPKTVIAEIEKQHGEMGINYLISYLFFGQMSFPDAMRSMQLFSTEVMPKIAHL